VKKTVLVYGLLAGALIALLRLVEYRYLVLEHSLEIYGGIIAAIFSAVGIWLGLKLTRSRPTVIETVVTKEVPVEVRVPVPTTGPFVRNQARVEQLGLTPRELDILEAMAAGLSNREIADKSRQIDDTYNLPPVVRQISAVFQKRLRKVWFAQWGITTLVTQEVADIQ